jgi:hypothetical protein
VHRIVVVLYVHAIRQAREGASNKVWGGLNFKSWLNFVHLFIAQEPVASVLCKSVRVQCRGRHYMGHSYARPNTGAIDIEPLGASSVYVGCAHRMPPHSKLAVP